MQYRISAEIEWHGGNCRPRRSRNRTSRVFDAETRRRRGRRGEAGRERAGSGFTRRPGGGARGDRGGKRSELRSDAQGGALCHLGIGISEGGPAGRALLPVRAKPFAEVVPGKYLIPHVAGDGAGLLPAEPFDTLHEGHPLLDSRRTESGHHAADFEGPDWRAVAHFVDQAKFARFGGKTDSPGEGKLQRAPLSQGTGDRPVNQEGPEPEADFGEAETGLRTGHHDVAVGHQPDATPEGRTLDAGDERLAEARPNGEEPLVKGVDFLGMRALFDFGQV